MPGSSNPAPASVDVVIVGAGFAGLYMLHKVRALGFSARVFEAGSDVGGTWYWNRYPGARCDVESMQYSYSFDEALQQDWKWSEVFSAQPEILRYLQHVADRLDLRRDITFGTRVTSAVFDETAARWRIGTERGETVNAWYCIMATGCLSAARTPPIPGIERFRGKSYHTATWPKDPVSFGGKRVGVIGTGSSGIQSVPVIAQEAAQLVVFQRTPNYSVPARNAPLPESYEREWKSEYAARRIAARDTKSGTLYDYNTKNALDVSPDERQREYEARWEKGGPNFMRSFADLTSNLAANETAAEFVRGRIRQAVRDPAIAERLEPRDYPIGAKRICVDSGYFETFNRPNVQLVDLRETPILEITEHGIATSAAEYPLDALVFATGFDAMTGALLAMDMRGRGGLTLQEKWQAGPRNYLGLMPEGFPNLFTVTGPGSPSVLSNVVHSIEQHVDWIADCLDYLRRNGHATIEADKDAEERWVAHVNEAANGTLYPLAASWYMGANIPGKPRVFMPYIGGVNKYRAICDAVAANGYEGFRLS